MPRPDLARPGQETINVRYNLIAKWLDVAGVLGTPHRPEAIRAPESY